MIFYCWEYKFKFLISFYKVKLYYEEFFYYKFKILKYIFDFLIKFFINFLNNKF